MTTSTHLIWLSFVPAIGFAVAGMFAAYQEAYEWSLGFCSLSFLTSMRFALTK